MPVLLGASFASPFLQYQHQQPSKDVRSPQQKQQAHLQQVDRVIEATAQASNLSALQEVLSTPAFNTESDLVKYLQEGLYHVEMAMLFTEFKVALIQSVKDGNDQCLGDFNRKMFGEWNAPGGTNASKKLNFLLLNITDTIDRNVHFVQARNSLIDDINEILSEAAKKLNKEPLYISVLQHELLNYHYASADNGVEMQENKEPETQPLYQMIC